MVRPRREVFPWPTSVVSDPSASSLRDWNREVFALSTFNVSTEADLRAAIASADSNNSSSNTINVTASIDLTDVAAGQMEIQNGTGTAKTLTI